MFLHALPLRSDITVMSLRRSLLQQYQGIVIMITSQMLKDTTIVQKLRETLSTNICLLMFAFDPYRGSPWVFILYMAQLVVFQDGRLKILKSSIYQFIYQIPCVYILKHVYDIISMIQGHINLLIIYCFIGRIPYLAIYCLFVIIHAIQFEIKFPVKF